MYDARLNLSRQVALDAREYFGDRVLQTMIPRNIRLAEAPSHGKPIILYDVASVGAQCYVNAARELLDRYHVPSTASVVHPATPPARPFPDHADHAAAP
jgi:chromosome partitioning protein